MRNPNRIVIELDDSGPVCVRATYPDEAIVIIQHVKPRFGDGQLVYGDSGEPIRPLAVVGEEVRFEVGDETKIS